LEAEFNEAELLPKTKEAAIMAATAYIAANASNNDKHMRHLRNLALEGVSVTTRKKKSPILGLFVIFFFTSSWRRASSCIYNLHAL
jgi:hypothetical protein